MVDYYKVLGIKPGCSYGEIKRSFRKKAKKFHPDLKSSGTTESEDAMRNLLNAYKILSNPEKRSDYDHAFVVYFSSSKFDYLNFLRSRRDDLYCQAKLIFHELLNSNYEEALALFDELNDKYAHFDLELYLGHEDHMDCLFLLAEALEKKREYIRACSLYKRIYLCEQEIPYYHHFIEEVIERLRNITCFKMVSSLSSENTIHYIEDLIDFNFSRKDNAFFYKKISEIYCSMSQKQLALQYLQKGLELDQRLPGVKKLKEKIGYTEIPAGL